MFAVVIATSLAVIFAIFMDLGRHVQLSESRIRIKYSHVLLCLAFSALLSVLSLHELTAGFATDSFYHSYLSLFHGMRLLKADYFPTESTIFQSMMNLPYGRILYVINFCLMAVLTFFFFMIASIRFRILRFFSYAAFFLTIRLLIRNFIIQGDIHPPLRLLPLNISSLIGGVGEASFRVPGLIALSALATMMVSSLRLKLGTLCAVAAALVISTLPLLWHVSVIPEASIWSASAFATVTICLLSAEASSQRAPFRMLFVLLAIASLMRQSAFLGLIPLGICYLSDLYKNETGTKPRVRRVIIDLWPVMIMVPWTLFIAYTGTPASDRSGASWIGKMQQAIGDGEAIRYLWNHWRWPGFILLLCGMIPRKSWAYFFAISTFGLALCLFYSIIPRLWGLARYQLELGLPLVLLGTINVVQLLKKGLSYLGRYGDERLVLAISVILAVFNYREFKSIRRVDGAVDESTYFDRSRDGSIPSLSEYPFATSKALKIAKEKNLQVGLFIDGISYGVIPQVLAGYSWSEVRMAEGMPIAWGGADANLVDKAPVVRSIVLLDWGYERNKQSAAILKSLGWSEVAEVPDEDVPGNVIRILRRPE